MQNFFKYCSNIATNREMSVSSSASGSAFPREADTDPDVTAFIVSNSSRAEVVSGQRKMRELPGDMPTGSNPRKAEPPGAATGGLPCLGSASSSIAQPPGGIGARQSKLCMGSSEAGADDAGKEEFPEGPAGRGRSFYQAPVEDKAPTGRAISPESAFKEPSFECPETPTGRPRLEYMADCKDNSQSKRMPNQSRKAEPKFEQVASSSSSLPKKQIEPQSKDAGQQPKDLDMRYPDVSLQPKDC